MLVLFLILGVAVVLLFGLTRATWLCLEELRAIRRRLEEAAPRPRGDDLAER